jgi:hypothetical protein
MEDKDIMLMSLMRGLRVIYTVRYVTYFTKYFNL